MLLDARNKGKIIKIGDKSDKYGQNGLLILHAKYEMDNDIRYKQQSMDKHL